ncbi:MAG: hypothetical protein AAGE18_02215 [Pseudomonadota bacterium]
MIRQRETVLLDLTLPRTLRSIAERVPAETTAEIWVFDGVAERRAAEQHGIRLRPAFKPLVHWLIEERPADAASIDILYPVVVDVPPERFLREAYPAADLPHVPPITFAPLPPARYEATPPAYRAQTTLRDGTVRSAAIPAPNRWRQDASGERCLAPAGWLRLRSAESGAVVEDRPFPTDLEQAFAAFEAALAEIAVPDDPEVLIFEQFHVTLTCGAADRPLGVGSEGLRLTEALEEDLYFTALEHFRRRRGTGPQDRSAIVGQIVPEVRVAAPGADLHLTVATRPPPRLRPAAALDGPLPQDAIAAALDALGGQPFGTTSRQGRPVQGRGFGTDPGNAAMISAGQHGNEPTGIVGALRAAETLLASGERDLALCPLENPDGHALYLSAFARAPEHMHHAGRFTAAGNDIGQGTGVEEEVHRTARRQAGGLLHISLHGYPAHEWVRPMTGYLPAGYAEWMLPRGFMLILRTTAAHKPLAEAILQAAARAATLDPAIRALNATEIARARRYGVAIPRTIAGAPVFAKVVEDGRWPITLITEAPDESVSGPRFALLAAAQARAAVAAVGALRNFDPDAVAG